MPVERRPVAGVLAMALVEGVAVRAEPLAHETGISIIGVGDEQGAHGRYGTGSGGGDALDRERDQSVEMNTFLSSE